MNDEDVKNKVEERWRRHRRHSERGRVFGGLALLVVGGLYLAKVSGVPFPGWFFSWPVLLIGIGLFSGIRHGFRGIGWLLPMAIGVIFLTDKLSPDTHLKHYMWPMLLIAAGLFIIFRPKNRYCRRSEGRDGKDLSENVAQTDDERTGWRNAMRDGTDVTDITAVFGGVKKNILAKNFKGGDVTAFMGGAELNLSQADFTGTAVIDCFNMFGGTKIIVPPDWEVQSDIVAIFGGVEDKRPASANVSPSKVLKLDGTCIFGGVEIRSY